MSPNPRMDAWDAYVRGEGPNPFASAPMDYANFSSLMPPPSDMDELGTLDYARDTANYTQDINDIISDPAYRAQLSVGGGIGGWEPADLEPTITFEPVQAPGYQRLMFLKGSGDPIQEYIADAIANNGTAFAAVEALKMAAKDGGTGGQFPLIDAAVQRLPTYENQRGAEDTDWKKIEKMANDLETLVINDPQFNGFQNGLPASIVDAETGQMRNDYTMGADGQLMKKVETPSTAQEYLTRNNLPSPFDTYSPDTLASDSTLIREDREGTNLLNGTSIYRADGETLNDLGTSAQQVGEASDVITQMMRQFNRDQKRKQADYQTAMMGPQFDREGWVDGKDEREAVLGGGAGSLSMEGGAASPAAMRRQDVFDRSRKSADAQTRAMARMAGPRERGPLADKPNDPRRVAYRNALQGRIDAKNAAAHNYMAQRMREKMMGQITAAGHTPYNDKMQAMQRNVLGF